MSSTFDKSVFNAQQEMNRQMDEYLERLLEDINRYYIPKLHRTCITNSLVIEYGPMSVRSAVNYFDVNTTLSADMTMKIKKRLKKLACEVCQPKIDEWDLEIYDE